MKANVRWEYLPGVKDGDLYDFTMDKDLTLDLLSEGESDSKQTFLKGKTVKGAPAMVTIHDPKTNKVAKIEGVLVREADGIYVVAKNFVKAPIQTTKDATVGTVKGVEQAASDVIDTAKKIDTEKSLGFTKKQLVVMAVAMIILIKVIK